MVRRRVNWLWVLTCLEKQLAPNAYLLASLAPFAAIYDLKQISFGDSNG
jgi:hypothetical protein